MPVTELGANTSLLAGIWDPSFGFTEPPMAPGLWVTASHPSPFTPRGFYLDFTLTVPFSLDKKGNFCLLLSSRGKVENLLELQEEPREDQLRITA